ncbi:MAG: hypothetical protein ACRC0V_05980 [Fusobacteriaceae bacterium]
MKKTLENVVDFLELVGLYDQVVKFKDDKVLVLDTEYEELDKYTYKQYAKFLLDVWMTNEYLEDRMLMLSNDSRQCRIYVEEFLEYRKELEILTQDYTSNVSYVNALKFSGNKNPQEIKELIAYLKYCLVTDYDDMGIDYKTECLDYIINLSKMI